MCWYDENLSNSEKRFKYSGESNKTNALSTQPTQRRRKDVVRTSYFWSQRRLRLV